MDYYLDAWRNFANFKGRATRKQFWMFVLVNLIVSIALQIIEAVIGFADFELLSGLYGLAVLIPGLAITARRLHDINKSAWWLLLLLIPFIGGLVILIFNIKKGDENANKYGAPVSIDGTDGERTSPTGEKIRDAEVVSEKQKVADDELLKEDLEDK